MTPIKLFFSLAAVLTSSLASPTGSSPLTSRDTVGPYWQGWENINHFFVFGDSYTRTAFSLKSTWPSASNPIGNPAFPGNTVADGPNWVSYLTGTYNASLVLTYDFAIAGATVDSILVPPYNAAVLSVAAQVETEWIPTFGPNGTGAAQVPWTAADSLFAVWIGINDVDLTYANGTNVTDILNVAIVTRYIQVVEELYEAGARNFLFLNVPAIERSPNIQEKGTDAVEALREDVLAFNKLLANMVEIIGGLEDVSVFTVDTYQLFNEILDDPTSHPQTAGLTNTTDWCTYYYASNTQNTTYYDPRCGVPVYEYFWFNDFHPMFPVHDAVTSLVLKTLEAVS